MGLGSSCHFIFLNPFILCSFFLSREIRLFVSFLVKPFTPHFISYPFLFPFSNRLAYLLISFRPKALSTHADKTCHVPTSTNAIHTCSQLNPSFLPRNKIISPLYTHKKQSNTKNANKNSRKTTSDFFYIEKSKIQNTSNHLSTKSL